MNTDTDTKDKTIREILIAKDEVSLVESDGTFIGPEDKFDAHKYPSKLHLAISVWLFNSKGEVLLQKRSNEKIVGAGWWANSACGNAWPTETFYDCANRRLDKELGLQGVSVKPIFKFSYKAYGNELYGEHEIDQVYIGLLNQQIHINKEEVSEVCWVDFKELYTTISTVEYIASEQTLSILDTKELQEKTPTLKVTISGKELLLAPWTVLMLKNAQLFDAFKDLLS